MEKQDCSTCQFARWYRTDAGRLHPSGDGRCEFPFRNKFAELKIPAAYYALTVPSFGGGHISRRKPLDEPCPCYTQKADDTP